MATEKRTRKLSYDSDKSYDSTKNEDDHKNHGDWVCPETDCGNVNFAKRSSCNRCGKERAECPKKKKLGHEIGKAAAEKSRGLFSADDWQCNKCGNVNWARRQQCNMCNAPKFGDVEERTGYGGGYNDRGVVEYKERVSDDDDDYDEFGRRKKKRRLESRSDDDSKDSRTSSPQRHKSKHSENKDESEEDYEKNDNSEKEEFEEDGEDREDREDREEEDEDSDGDEDLSKYDLTFDDLKPATKDTNHDAGSSEERQLR